MKTWLKLRPDTSVHEFMLELTAEASLPTARAPLSLRAWVGVVAWLLAIVLSLGALWAHAIAPGRAADAPARWPAAARVQLDGRPTLLVTVHAYCPCSRATFSELERLLAHAPVAPRTVVLLELPDRVDDAQYRASSAYARASAMRGVEVVRDSGGGDASLLGAHTSGQAYLFDADGALLFAGGLTVARAHEGESRGDREILAALEHAQPEAPTPVFGCSLDEERAR